MQILQNGRFAVSTWSLHRLLGAVYAYSPDPDKSSAPKEPYGPGAAALIDIPAALAARGVNRLEVCSFHLPSLEAGYLSDLRDAMTASKVLFQTLLVEDGDPSHAETAERDVRWMAEWIDIAAALGAQRMRVIAGKQKPTEENLNRAACHLGWLAEKAEGSGVRIVVENWFDLLPSPVEMNWLLDRLDGKVGSTATLAIGRHPRNMKAWPTSCAVPRSATPRPITVLAGSMPTITAGAWKCARGPVMPVPLR